MKKETKEQKKIALPKNVVLGSKPRAKRVQEEMIPIMVAEYGDNFDENHFKVVDGIGSYQKMISVATVAPKNAKEGNEMAEFIIDNINNILGLEKDKLKITIIYQTYVNGIHTRSFIWGKSDIDFMYTTY